MKQKFMICRHCGNLVAWIRDKGVPILCCGEAMEPLLPNGTEGAGEKHNPVVTVSGDRVIVQVGAKEHPMTDGHFIEWVCLETERGVQYVQLKPGDKPEACFPICQGEKILAVYAFCNQHDLWRK